MTLAHEIKAAGIPFAVASDNTRDQFYAYGDLDMMEVFTQVQSHCSFQVGLEVPDWVTRHGFGAAGLQDLSPGQTLRGLAGGCDFHPC